MARPCEEMSRRALPHRLPCLIRRAMFRAMSFFRSLVVLIALGAAELHAQSAPDESSLGIIPRPRRLTTHAGSFTIGARTVIWTDVASAAEGRKLARLLERGTGLTLAVRTGGTPPTANVIELHRSRSLADTLGPEGYRLRVRVGRVVVRAAGDAGLCYATQTMRPLLAPAA